MSKIKVLKERVSDYIFSKAPWVTNIEVYIEKSKIGGFNTKIKIIAKNKVFFASKNGEFLEKSIHRCLDAAMKQIFKYKTITHQHLDIQYEYLVNAS